MSVYEEIQAERDRQNARFGQQNHTSGAHPNFTPYATFARKTCDVNTSGGTLTWKHIAEEEFWEAFSELDPAKRRVELVQLAAVIVACIESEDRRAAVKK